MTLIQHAIVPSFALEPPMFYDERVIRGNTYVKGRLPISEAVFESNTLGSLTMKTYRPESGHPTFGLLDICVSGYRQGLDKSVDVH